MSKILGGKEFQSLIINNWNSLSPYIFNYYPWPQTEFESITWSVDRDEFKQVEISSCIAGLVLDIGWNGDCLSIVFIQSRFPR